MTEMTLIRIYKCALLTLFCLGYVKSQNTSGLPVGSPRRCLSTKGEHLTRFEVLVGGGWDNLRNKDMAMVMAQDYTQCHTTDDGHYLVPDNMYTIPIKTSKVDTYAEMINHWNDYTSTTSSSINVHAGLHLKNFGVDGKFTKGYESVKQHQYNDKAVTTRVQVRYARYKALLNPGSRLNHEFRRRLQKIGARIRLNRTDSARFESQLILRDYGTHVVTGLDAGASLSQVDHITSSFVRDNDLTKNTILASASASFLNIFDFGIDYSHTTTDQMIDQYQKSRTSSEVETFGGPVFRPKAYTANNWSTQIDDDLVAIDRSGEPLYYVINEEKLPELPPSTVTQIYDYIKEAIEIYYKQNTYRGCTDPEAPNFSFHANVDDGMCLPTKTDYTFGGVYQSCTNSGHTDLCANMKQKNPITGEYSCPEGYEAVKLQDGSKSASTTRQECHRCWIFAHCCKDKTYTSSAQYTAYWCAASGLVKQNSGFLFGGLYTSSISNPMTGASTCPVQFYALNILDNLVVCVSDDYELGTQYSLPFAGFFSCKSGNPLSLNDKPKQNNTKLMQFMLSSGSTPYPHRCPNGYSQHMVVNDRGCEINYCVKSGALSLPDLPVIHLPPFMHKPSDGPQIETSVVLNDDGTIWTDLVAAKEMFELQPISAESWRFSINGSLMPNDTGSGSGVSLSPESSLSPAAKNASGYVRSSSPEILLSPAAGKNKSDIVESASTESSLSPAAEKSGRENGKSSNTEDSLSPGAAAAIATLATVAFMLVVLMAVLYVKRRPVEYTQV